MKKERNIFSAIKIPAGILLEASLVLCGIPSYAGAASADGTAEDLARFEVIHREYDSNEDGFLRYHYEDENGNTINLSGTADESTSTRRKASSVPSSFDLRDQNMVTPIKDQGITGACWSFATIKSIESNLAMQGIQSTDNLDLSESHLIWYTYHPSTTIGDPLYREGATDSSFSSGNTSAYNAGGNAILTSFILSRWTGAVTEAAAPFQANTVRELATTANTMASQSEMLRYRSDYIVTDIVCYDGASREKIQETIMQNGAMDVSYYTDNSLYHQTGTAGTSYYQEKITGSRAIESANHSVTIIGWDNNYSKENFGTYKPSSDGAWLIANSYGSSFGDNGCFWLSYEEPSLTEFYSYTATTSDTYDNNYQYDAYGWGNAITDPLYDTTQAANIFVANEENQQSLTSVGVYSVADQQPYTIKIYRGVSSGKPESGTLVSTTSGTLDFEGYHTIPLNRAVSLNPGERFSVVIAYEKTNKETGFIPLEGENYREGSYTVNYTSNAGESFIYSSGKWIDLKSSFTRGIKNNFCIKAFTKNTAAATGTISLSRSNITLGAGESFTVTSTVQNIQDKTVTYTSSNPAVATVNSSGRITAKSAGSTTITASLVSGRYAEITVTVKKAPSKITATPSKKTIKKSQSFKIKVSFPSGSYSRGITYSSSKPSVANVNASGKVTGKKKGKAVITVKAHNGKTAKINVTVK